MSPLSPKYDPSIHKELKKVDWDSVLPAVFKYARAKAKIFSWLGDEVDPESLVNEAVARAYGNGTDGHRNGNVESGLL